MRITGIETIHLADYPLLLFVGVHTDTGLVGWSDTLYMSAAMEGYLHQFAAPMLIGHDPLQIELHWRRLYEVCAHSVGKGAELRGLSALDCALWDLFGKSTGLPVWQLLGGAARPRIRTYNTCGGPGYGRPTADRAEYGVAAGDSGRFEDLAAFLTRPGELARELRDAGYSGMKLWPFDYVAHDPGEFDRWPSFRGVFDPQRTRLDGQHISASDLERCLAPVRAIRDAVGDDLEIMIEGHGLWSLPAAIRIARALEPFRPAWLEDLMRADSIDGLAELRRATTIPILASEYLATRYEYQPLLERQACDIVMVDPTWAGGITECRKIAALAETHKRPVAMHDCTGPLTLLAGIHLAIHCTNAVWQESVRAYLHITYPELVDEVPQAVDGHFTAPTRPGIGAAPRADLRDRPDATCRVTSAS